jgi:hypothetical protein
MSFKDIMQNLLTPESKPDSDISQGVFYNHPKLNNLIACEEKRWKAYQYKISQFIKIDHILNTLYKHSPFCCVLPHKKGFEYSWLVFDEIGWHVQSERPKFLPLNQQLGYDFINYKNRSQTIRRRVFLFEELFKQSFEQWLVELNKHYRFAFDQKLKIILNGREYIFDSKEIVYPEDILTFTVNEINEIENIGVDSQLT